MKWSMRRMLLALPMMALAALLPGCDPDDRPNVVVIMTDDQTLDSLRFMPATLDLIGKHGTTFTNSFVSYPLCCPSRATFLTGQYSHNHGVQWNTPPAGGYAGLDHTDTLPVWLQDAGYATTHIGKYLNGYGMTDLDPDVPDRREVPPGWTDWQGLVDPTTYRMYGYTINDNGALVDYGQDPEDYQTDVIANRAVSAIAERAPGAPFFLSVAPLAPHFEGGGIGPRAAPRHEGDFAGEPLPQPPSFDEPSVADKPSFIRSLPRITPEVRAHITTVYRDRLESLLAVDELVGRVVAALEAAGELDRTVILFTADNGFMAGEHRIPERKYVLYEESARVPLLVRGGGFPSNATAGQLVANVDLAPTIVELTEATPGHEMDGRSLLTRALDPDAGNDRSLLLETVGHTNRPTYRAVRTERYVYAEHSTGELELYDLAIDPWQLTSRHAAAAYDDEEAVLRARLDGLRSCAGPSCSGGS